MFTRTQPTWRFRSIIDYVVLRQEYKIKSIAVMVYRGSECGTEKATNPKKINIDFFLAHFQQGGYLFIIILKQQTFWIESLLIDGWNKRPNSLVRTVTRFNTHRFLSLGCCKNEVYKRYQNVVEIEDNITNIANNFKSAIL